MPKHKIIDLSFTIHSGMQVFSSPWHPAVAITQLAFHHKQNRETRKIVMGTHAGTHTDAPRHFIKNGKTIDKIPLDVYVGPATVLNFTKIPQKTEIDLTTLKKALGKNSCERIICRFDWDKHYGKKKYYTDHAFFSEDACRWLVKNGCRLMALDTPQPDNPQNGFGSGNDAPNHKILLGKGVVLVEYLTNLKKITKSRVQLFAAPLKIKDGDGAPARCFVIENG